MPDLETGSGLNTAEVAFRLRYEFTPYFAPYVGFQHEHSIGQTARYRRDAGDSTGEWTWLIGVRGWF